MWPPAFAGLRKLAYSVYGRAMGLWIRMTLKSGLIGEVAIERSYGYTGAYAQTAQQKNISARSMRKSRLTRGWEILSLLMDKAAVLFTNTLNYGKK